MTTGFRRVAAATVVIATLGGCAVEPPPGQLIADPLEPLNRTIHAVNLTADTFVVRPASVLYDKVAPDLVKHLAGNFIDHIRLPVVFFNQVLQGEVDLALNTAGRFAINTFMGAAGALDPATEIGLPRTSTDFGLTLASYGVEEGIYVVLPIFGPSTARDALGRAGDILMNPVLWVNADSDLWTAFEVATLTGDPVISRARAAPVLNPLLDDSEDSYVALRSAFIQNRRARVSGGAIAVDDLPDIFADEDEQQ